MGSFKDTLVKIPVIGPIGKSIYRAIVGKKKFPGSPNYWEERYSAGGNSGSGSYNRLAEFKAEVLNAFVAENGIQRVMEFGCGDGNQLTLAKYPEYVGLDVAPTAITICMKQFAGDNSKAFYVYNSLAFRDTFGLFKADLTMSLDVIYHLVEDVVFDTYMRHLFDASKKYVAIYASNYDLQQNFHERDRKFTDWIERNRPGFKQIKYVENRYKTDPNDPDHSSKADFFFFEKQ